MMITIENERETWMFSHPYTARIIQLLQCVDWNRPPPPPSPESIRQKIKHVPKHSDNNIKKLSNWSGGGGGGGVLKFFFYICIKQKKGQN